MIQWHLEKRLQNPRIYKCTNCQEEMVGAFKTSRINIDDEFASPFCGYDCMYQYKKKVKGTYHQNIAFSQFQKKR